MMPPKGMVMKPLDESVQLPEIIYDADALSAMAKAAGVLIKEPINAGDAVVNRLALAYLVCVNEVGEIVTAEPAIGPNVPGIQDALRRARVVAPGRRGVETVPTALLVPIP